MVCNFNCFIETEFTEGLRKVTGSHVGLPSKMVISRKLCEIKTLLLESDIMAHRIATIPMTLNDLQCHSPVASLFKWDFFSYSCGAADKISTDISRCAALCDSLSFLFGLAPAPAPFITFSLIAWTLLAIQ